MSRKMFRPALVTQRGRGLAAAAYDLSASGTFTTVDGPPAVTA